VQPPGMAVISPPMGCVCHAVIGLGPAIHIAFNVCALPSQVSASFSHVEEYAKPSAVEDTNNNNAILGVKVLSQFFDEHKQQFGGSRVLLSASFCFHFTFSFVWTLSVIVLSSCLLLFIVPMFKTNRFLPLDLTASRPAQPQKKAKRKGLSNAHILF